MCHGYYRYPLIQTEILNLVIYRLPGTLDANIEKLLYIYTYILNDIKKNLILKMEQGSNVKKYKNKLEMKEIQKQLRLKKQIIEVS